MTEQAPRVFMTLETFFSGLRCQDNKFVSTQWKIEADFFALKKDGEEYDNLVDMATVKWQAINFWLGLLNDIIIFDINDEWALNGVKAILPNNLVMTLPTFPTDDLIAAALAEKLNTIADGHLYCSRVSIRSEEIGVKYTVLAEEGETILPDISYAGDNTHSSVPWWRRHDSETFDINLDDEDSDIETNVTELKKGVSNDVLLQFERRVSEKLRGVSDPSAVFEIIFDQDTNMFIDLENDNEDEDSSNIIEPEWDRDK